MPSPKNSVDNVSTCSSQLNEEPAVQEKETPPDGFTDVLHGLIGWALLVPTPMEVISNENRALRKYKDVMGLQKGIPK